MWRKMVAQIGLKKRGLKKRGSITSGYKTCFWFDKMWFHDNGFVKMWFQKSWVDSTWLTWFEKCVSISMMFEKMISRTHAGKHVQFFHHAPTKSNIQIPKPNGLRFSLRFSNHMVQFPSGSCQKKTSSKTSQGPNHVAHTSQP